MKLFLAVPRPAQQGKSQTLASAGRTREWVARLPLLDTRESLLQIHRSLQSLNRTNLRIPQRLRLLDMHRSPLRVIRGQVESHFSRGAAPLSQDDLLIAGLFRDCCVEMAFGYKIIVLEIAQRRKRRQLEEMKLSMARALFYLEQTIFASALFRQSPPEGIWQEVHTVYSYARTLGIDEAPLKDPVTKVKTSTTISLTYRRALLFGLSDPFHQSVSLMGRMQEFLRRNAGNARIKKHVRTARGHCEFVIDLQSDRPARPYAKEDKAPKNALFLDTLELTRNARDVLEDMQSGDQGEIELEGDFKDDLGRKLLDDVVYKLGLVTTRGSERSEGGEARAQFMIGIEAASYCANNESPVALSSLDHEGGKTTQGTPAHLLPMRESDLAIVEGYILDRSESGVRITVPYAAAPAGALRVGEVITCRGDGDYWIPGVIRWMRGIDDAIHIGVLKIPDSARAVGVKRVSTEREDAFRAGLAIYPEEDADASALQIITRPGLYRHQRNLFIDDGQALLMARTRQLLESSPAVEWFECETINL